MQEQNSRLRKRTPVERIILAAIILVFAAWAAASRLSSVPYTIAVDGQPLVSVESLRAAKSAMKLARLQTSQGVPSNAVRFTRKIAIFKSPVGMDITDVPEAVKAIQRATSVEAELYAVVADGQPVVALPDKTSAEKTLELVKQNYETRLSKVKVESQFKESVYTQECFVDLARYRSTPTEAAQFLMSSTSEPVVHVVSRGDRAIKLARQYGMSLDDLHRQNPSKNMGQLTEGDLLLIVPAKKPVTVVSRAHVSKTVTVSGPSTGTGKRQVQLLVTYENGVPVNEEALSQITVWKRSGSRYIGDDDQPRSQRRYRRNYHRKRTSDTAGITTVNKE